MCGIVGYIGSRNVLPILIDGLRRLEYRGYDSAGVALFQKDSLVVFKQAGKVNELAATLNGIKINSSAGMGHTRWATHGSPNDINAHPHGDCRDRIAVIHNGIIENFSTLRKKLEQSGHTMRTETDTEVIAHLIEEKYKDNPDLLSATRLALLELRGTYGLLVMSSDEPEKIIAARRGSPLMIGVGKGENFIASDAAALIDHTRNVIYLDDDDIASVRADSYSIKTIRDELKNKTIEEITFNIEQIEKGGFNHFMLKEIYEQPESIRNALRGRLLVDEGRVKLGGLEPALDRLLQAHRVLITACGTSWHAALVGKHLFEQLARIPVEVDYASEFRYRNPIVHSQDILFVISQSGETADTLAALREAKSKSATVFGIVNVVGSSIARETDAGVYIHAGPEIGVASTKAFTSQLAVLALIALFIGRHRGLPDEQAKLLIEDLAEIPSKIQRVLDRVDEIKKIAYELKDSKNFLYLGRGSNFPTALEGALKLKEISYIHAEGYPAAEMKHGPIALIDKNMPVVFIVPKDPIYDKILSNMQEVKAREGRIIAIANEDDDDIDKIAEFVIRVPRTYGYFGPIVNVIPLQLLAYYIAIARGCDVDQPRNLAKSVTVE